MRYIVGGDKFMTSSVMQTSSVRAGLRTRFWGSHITGERLASMPSEALARKINVLLRGPNTKALVRLGPDNPKLDKRRMLSIQIAEILTDDAFSPAKVLEILEGVENRSNLFRDIATLDRQKAYFILISSVNKAYSGHELEGEVRGIEFKAFIPSSLLDKGAFALSLLNISSSWQERDFQKPILGILAHNSPEILREIIASASRRLYHPGMRNYYRFLLKIAGLDEAEFVKERNSERSMVKGMKPRSVLLTDIRDPFENIIEEQRPIEMILQKEFGSVHVSVTLEKDDHLELAEIQRLLIGLVSRNSYLYKIEPAGEFLASHAKVKSVSIKRVEELNFIRGLAFVKIYSDFEMGARMLLETPNGDKYLILETELKDDSYLTTKLYHLDLAYDQVGQPKERGVL